jgi:pimeloyl-ACP methyl ester carboxylesterase
VVSDRVTVVDGRDIRWRTAGSGSPTVVLEAGLTAAASEWARVQPRLALTTRVVAISRAGYGGSTPVARRPAQASVADLAAVLDEVHGPLVLVGHSWGGLLARLYTAQHPERVAALVLVDATHEYLAMMRTLRGQALGQIGMSLAALLARTGRMRRQLLAGRGPLGPALHRVDLPVRQQLVEEFSDVGTWQQARRDHAGVAAALRAMRAQPLPTPDVPVVAVVGALGPGRHAAARRTVIEAYARWLPSLPDGRLVMAPCSGHLVPLDDEDLLVEVVRNLVSEVRATASA